MMNYKELGQSHMAQFAEGVAQIDALANELFLQGKLPERFPSVKGLHPYLEGKAEVVPLTIGGKSKSQLWGEINKEGIHTGIHVGNVIANPDCTILPQPKPINIALVKVEYLEVPETGMDRGVHRISEVEARRDVLRLKPCPAEAAIHHILQYGSGMQPGQKLAINMEPIADVKEDNRPCAFKVECDEDGQLWLDTYCALPGIGFEQRQMVAFAIDD